MFIPKNDFLFAQFVKVLLDADDGQNAGGNGGDDQTSGEKVAETKKTAEEAAARAAQAERAKSKKQLAKRDEQIAELKDQLAHLEEVVNTYAEKTPVVTPEGKPTEEQEGGAAGALKVMLKKQERELEKLKLELQRQTERAAQAESARLEGERCRKIREVLSDIRCRDVTTGERFLSPIVARDEDDGELYVTLQDGSQAPLNKDSADQVVPDYLKVTDVPGGSGTTNGVTQRKEQQKELQAAKEELRNLQQQANRSGRDSDLSRYQKQKEIVRKMENEFAKVRS